MGTQVAKLLAAGGALVTFLAFAAWASAGFHMVTQHQVAETRQVEDEFGDLIEVTEMTDSFRYGLLPDRWYDGALLPLGFGVALLVGAGLMSRRRSKSTPTA